jgi:fibronectin type 3 domain-containing protein
MLLVASFSMLAACGGGPEAAGVSSGGGGVVITCASGGNSATLTWDAIADPDLAGYRVYYGTAPGTYIQARGGGDPVAANVTTHTVTGLASGTTHYFAITAYGNNQRESDFSNEVCKTTS